MHIYAHFCIAYIFSLVRPGPRGIFVFEKYLILSGFMAVSKSAVVGNFCSKGKVQCAELC